jgi:hypothetical protein
MPPADWRHLNNLSVNKLDAIVLSEDPNLSHLMVLVRSESSPSQLKRHHILLVSNLFPPRFIAPMLQQDDVYVLRGVGAKHSHTGG